MAQPGQMPPGGGMAVPFTLQPGQQPTPEQIRQIQAQIAAEAQRHGISVQEYVERMKAQMIQAQMQQQAQMQAQQQMQQQQQGGGGAPGGPQAQAQAQAQAQQQQQRQQQLHNKGAQPGQQQVIQQGQPPTPESLALANFLRSQDLKPRTCILQDKRKDMFKVKRAIRALHSEAYQKARKKNPLLPEVNDRVTAENTFKLLPRSFLALRVTKVDPHEGHGHAPPAKKKRVKGLWTVKIEPQQEAADEFYYVWLYEGSQWKNQLYAVGALVGILAVVFFPVWPYHLRLGVWYLSMGMLGLLGLFFAMAIFRLILFVITMFLTPPGLWLYPNLFEDVGFFDSFRPVWAWHEDELAIKKRKKEERARKKARREAKGSGKAEKKKLLDGDAPAEEAEAVEEGKQEAPAQAAAEKVAEVTEEDDAEEAAEDAGEAENDQTSSPQQRKNLTATVEEEDD